MIKLLVPVVNPTPGVIAQGQGTVELQVGQTCRATVVALEGDSAILRLNGALIRAQGQALTVGQLLYLRVEEASSLKIVLKILPTDSVSPAPANLEQVLVEMGVAPSTPNIASARALLAALQPVIPSDVTQLAGELKSLSPTEQASYLTVRSWSKSLGLPEDKASVRTVTRFLLGAAQAEEIPEALRLINDYPQVGILWWQRPPGHGEIYILRERQSENTYEPDHHDVAIRLQTQLLGELWVSFHYLRPHLQLSIYSPHPSVLEELQQQSTVLTTTLSMLGVSLSELRFEQSQPSSFLEALSLRTATQHYTGLNIKV